MKQKHILNQLLLEHFSLCYEKNCQASINYPHAPKRQVGCHADTNLHSLHRINLHRLKTIPTASSKVPLLRGCNQLLKAECINVTFKDKPCQIQKMFKVTPSTVWMSTLGFIFTVGHFYLFGYWLAESCYSISATTKPSTREVPSLDLAWRSSTLENRYWSVISLVFKWMLPPS